MRELRKVSKLEEINSLKQTLVYNENALDYMQNNIYRTENMYKLDESDKEVKERLNTERYIKFSLEYLNKQYANRLKSLGVKVW